MASAGVLLSGMPVKAHRTALLDTYIATTINRNPMPSVSDAVEEGAGWVHSFMPLRVLKNV